jgi:hypothetical protein
MAVSRTTSSEGFFFSYRVPSSVYSGSRSYSSRCVRQRFKKKENKKEKKKKKKQKKKTPVHEKQSHARLQSHSGSGLKGPGVRQTLKIDGEWGKEKLSHLRITETTFQDYQDAAYADHGYHRHRWHSNYHSGHS